MRLLLDPPPGPRREDHELVDLLPVLHLHHQPGVPLGQRRERRHRCCFGPEGGSGTDRQAKLQSARSQLYRRRILQLKPH